MAEHDYQYVIIGGGPAGAAAIEGIRERDHDGRILLVGAEKHLPYDRPPLSKKLWFGKKQVADIFLHDQAFYAANSTDLALGVRVVGLDPQRKTITDDQGDLHHYHKLLLATGGIPRTLGIPGGDLEGVCYYRYLDDYLTTRARATAAKSAVVIGGGFIGSEMAAALSLNQVEVTMVFPEQCLVARVFPETLGRSLQQTYIERGITVLSGDVPTAIERHDDALIVATRGGRRLRADIVIAGIGIAPASELAAGAGLTLDDGIVVDEYLRTSAPDIHAAGDNAFFPYQVLGQRTRVEHWDNAVNQGKQAGRNLAGAQEAFTYMPYFFSDLFDFGYEAVGEVDARLETFADWRQENDTGVIYYLREGQVRGAMMCNVWDQVEAARELIRGGRRMTAEDLRGAIK
ncbi:MAG TPA: FAD-dependent oxidoreductase [Armatimonadota bacterium]|nr:FAD-dependent oxidoreductase [Armatimonadota bacterium]